MAYLRTPPSLPDTTARMCTILPLVLLTTSILSSASGFSAIFPEQASVQGKKFGGYRIVPKTCADLTSNGKAKGVCMFNYECSQRDGQVVGSCMDGFLFGACCRLPPGSIYHGVDIPSSSPSTTSLSSLSSLSSLNPLKPVTLHPVGETILLHKNGSVVVDENDPLEFDLLKKPQENPASPEESTLSFVSEQETHLSPDNEIFTKPGFHDVSHWTTKYPQNLSVYSQGVSKTTQTLELDAVTPSMQGTTRHDEENFPSTPADNSMNKPFHSTFNSLHSTTKLPSYAYYTKPSPTKPPHRPGLVTKPISYTSSNQPLKPKPVTSNVYSQSTTEKSFTTHSTSYSDNLVFVPTLDHHRPNVEDVTNAASISHILHLLNETEPVPEPISTHSPNLSTWVSINGKPEKTDSSTNAYTTPHYFQYDTVPSTTVQHIQGPSFQVTPQVKITPKPQETTTPEPPPTVIVLGPFNTYSSSNKPQVTPSYNDPRPSQTVTVLSPFPHSTVVTVKPSGSVISVKPPPSTYHHHWTTSSPQVTVTHPSTSGSHQMTSPVHLITKPPKPYPSVYSTNKPVSFTTVKPITYVSPKPVSHVSSKPVLITSSSSKPGYPVKHRPSKPPSPNPNVETYSPHKPSQSSYITVQPAIVDKFGPPDDTLHQEFISSPAYDDPSNTSNMLVAFPPVRDPNITLLSSQSDKPDLLTSTTLADDELSTLNLVEDDALDGKVHDLVEKIVQSLEGNFVDLENVLMDGQTKPNATLTQKPLKKPTTASTTPTKPRPTKKPTTKPTTTQRPLVSITKPTSVKPDISIYTNKPSTTVLLTTYSKPEDLETNKPTKRPSTAPTLVLYQPSSTQTTTKRPTPTTVVVDSISLLDEQTEATASKPTTEVNFKKDCGVRPLMKNGRIVGGKGATFGEWPWQVLVREATWLGLFTKNKCGGVLIASRYVITAAHCQPGFLASLVAVFGEYDISGELESQRSVSKNVRRVIVHRQYDAATFENDIALLELESPIAFDSHIVPICMPRDEDDFTGRMATVTGWGRLKYGGGVPSVLQEVQVPVIENSVCQEMFHTAGHSKRIISSFLCAGYANGQRDSCEGDSGGPLMVERGDGRWVLAGTVSHGIKCAAPYLPGVYMRTTYYKPWLQTITGVRTT